MNSLPESGGGGADLLQQIWPELTPHEAKRMLGLHGGDVASCIRSISSKRSRGVLSQPSRDNITVEEGDTTSQLRTMIPVLTDRDASRLLAAKNDDVEKAADAFFMGHAPRPRTSSNGSGTASQTRSRSSSAASSKSAPSAKGKRRPMRYFGVSVMDLMSLPEHRNQTLPRIVVYLCEYLLARASRKAEDSAQNVLIDLRDIIQGPIDSILFHKAKTRFNEGNFYDCNSGICMFRLLKTFFRELPTPLIPRTFYEEALSCSNQHLQETVSRIQSHPSYVAFMDGNNVRGERAYALNTWIADHWAGTGDGTTPQGLSEQCAELNEVVQLVAFSVHQSMPNLAEFFFSLPRVTRNVLEYMGVCFVRLDLMCRKGNDDINQGIPEALMLLAETFAPHIMKPVNWTAADGNNKRQRQIRKRLQESFLLSFLYFIKRKHNLLSASERIAMNDFTENGVQGLIESLLNERISSPTRMAQSLDRIRIPRSVTPLSMANSDAGSYVGSYSASISPSHHRGLPEMIDVRLDREGMSLGGNRADDTWSNYAESGDEVYGLSPQGSPAQSPVVSRRGSPSLDTGSASSLFAINDLDSDCHSGRVLCSWDPVPDEKTLSDDYVLQHAACLGRWLDEAFLPYDVQSQDGFFAIGDPPDTAAFRSESAKLQDIEFSTPPGELLLPLLGPEFSQEFKSKPTAQFFPTFVGVDDSGPQHSTPMQTPRRPLSTINAINYDYVMQFPRTHADTAKRQSSRTVLDRFLAYPTEVTMEKASYVGDTEEGTLNCALPVRFAKGHDRCAICGGSFGSIFSSAKRTFCRYCSRVVCQRCCNSKFLVPSYIMVKGDFTVHRVCQPCEHHLSKHLYTPCLELDRLSLEAISIIGSKQLEAVSQSREKVMKHLYYNILPDCPSRESIISLIPHKTMPYISIFSGSQSARVSLAGLCELQTASVLQDLDELEKLLQNHVRFCHHCCKVSKRCGAASFCKRISSARASIHIPASDSSSMADRTFTQANRSISLPDHSLAISSRSGALTLDGSSNTSLIERTMTELNAELEDCVTPTRQTSGFVPIGYESILENAHTPMNHIPVLNKDENLILCRTCRAYCHHECFRMAEAQCESCVQLRPDVIPTVRSFTPDRGHKSAQTSLAAPIWDTDCDPTWFGE